MLINHGHPIDDMTIDGDHIASMDGNNIAFTDFVERDFNFHTVLDQPSESWLLAKGIQQHLSRIIFCLFNQAPAKGKTPGHDRPWKNLDSAKTTDDHK